MSARDSESGSSTYKGGSGRAGGLGNGGLGGGMGGGGNYGGGMGGGAARNGGIGNRTGLATGNRMVGGMAQGRPGGMAMNPGAWGVRPQDIVTRAPMNRPTVPGLLSPTLPVPAAALPDERVLAVDEVPMPPTTTPTFQNPYEFNPTKIPQGVRDLIAQYQRTYGSAPSAPVDPHEYGNRYGGAGKPAGIYGVVGGGGIPGYNTSRDPNYRALGSGQTSINGTMGGFGSQGTPGAGARRY